MGGEERYRQAIAALYAYCENRNNPLSSPTYLKLIEDVLAAAAALLKNKRKRAGRKVNKS